MSFERASRVRGMRAPDLAILVLLSSTCRLSKRSILGGLVHTVGSEVGDTTNCIALDFNIRTQHLANEGFQAAKLDNEELVVS